MYVRIKINLFIYRISNIPESCFVTNIECMYVMYQLNNFIKCNYQFYDQYKKEKDLHDK